MPNQALKALQEQFDEKVKAAEVLSTKADVSAEELSQYKTLVSEANGLKAQIEEIAATDGDFSALKAWNEQPANHLPQAGMKGAGVKAIPGSTPAGSTTIDLLTGDVVDESGLGVLSAPQFKAIASPEYLEAFPEILRAGGKIENVKSVTARKALVEGLDQDGGVLVPAQILAGMLMRDPATVRILDLLRTVTISSDRAVMLKSNYDADDLYSSAVRIYPTGEGAAATPTDQPIFGTFNVDVHQFTAEMSISRSLLEDTAFDLNGFVSGEFRTAGRNFAADKVLNGSGVGEHFGILTRAGQANGPEIVNSGNANLLTWDGLRRIKNAVPEQYDTNSRYVFNKKSTQDAIEALVDDNGRPLWPEAARSGLASGVPGTLQGYSYVREAFMPDVAANALPYIFGDLMGYIRALRVGMTIEPLRELEARRGLVVYLCRMREGGDIAEPWRMRVGKIAA